MRSKAFPLLLLVLVVAGAAVLAWPTRRDFLLGGIQVNEPDHAHWFDRLEAVGMNTVAVTVYAKQGDWDSANLWWEEEEPWVVSEMRSARREGLETVLVLRVALDHAFGRNKFFWHGMIMPRTDRELDEWFARYRDFVLEWAAVAEAEEVAVLAIGSELNALASTRPVEEIPALEEYWMNADKVAREHARVRRHGEEVDRRHLQVRGFDNSESLDLHLDERAAAHAAWARQVAWAESPDPVAAINRRRARLEAAWLELVAEVRRIYSGRLTYAANFDQYEEVGFWGPLDLVGVNAYFPLRKLWQPAVAAEELYPIFEARWEAILRSILALGERRGWGEKQILFTELGYVYRRNSTIEPWAATGFSVLPSATGEQLVVWEDEPIDLQERALAVRALYHADRAVGEPLAGILYWKLSTQPYHFDDEPFVLIIHPDARDPLLEELVRFRRWSPWEEIGRRFDRLGG
ncbi:MAG: hypothetical protein R3244_05860 [Thermoanaerobaculia bacterium]|nr:hypothetical protein [Thermoanaerobaculia bacterium]